MKSCRREASKTAIYSLKNHLLWQKAANKCQYYTVPIDMNDTVETHQSPGSTRRDKRLPKTWLYKWACSAKRVKNNSLTPPHLSAMSRANIHADLSSFYTALNEILVTQSRSPPDCQVSLQSGQCQMSVLPKAIGQHICLNSKWNQVQGRIICIGKCSTFFH